MIKPNELYDLTKLPVDEKLLDKLIQKYLQISLEDMNNEFSELQKLLYNQVNIINRNSNGVYNQDDLNKLIADINRDFTNAGRPYNPSLHNGITNPLGIMPGWTIFQSWNLLGTEEIKSNDISHRFYFGIDNAKLYELSQVLYDKLKRSNIPFYFKTDANQNIQRTDNLVLYTSTPLLEQTLKVIEEVQRERSDLLAKCSEPSIFAGKINNSIGYATEDHSTKTSYTDLICKTFLSSLNISMRTYINNNPNSPIKALYQQKIQEYIRIGKEIKTGRAKNRVLFDLLIKNDPNFKTILFNSFRQELTLQGIDVENICFNKTIKQEIEKIYGKTESLESDTITSPNGTTMTSQEWLDRNNILYWIPPNSLVSLKNGQVISGEEFIKGAISRAENFNSFQELFMHYCVKVDRQPSNQENISKVSSVLTPESSSSGGRK